MTYEMQPGLCIDPETRKDRSLESSATSLCAVPHIQIVSQIVVLKWMYACGNPVLPSHFVFIIELSHQSFSFKIRTHLCESLLIFAVYTQGVGEQWYLGIQKSLVDLNDRSTKALDGVCGTVWA